VLVRPLARGLAVSPPLTAEPEHFAMAAEAIEHGLARLAGQPSVR
jgi:adenosylmethionine-8-amino-7-oxononanoate aminotransferase